MKRTILCPLGQGVLAPKTQAELTVRTAAALAHAGANVILLAPAPLPGCEALFDSYGVPPSANLELVPISDAPRFLYKGRLVRRAMSIDAHAIYTAEAKVAAAFARKKKKLRAPIFFEASAIPGPIKKAAALFSAVDGLLVTMETTAARIRDAHAGVAPLHIVPRAAAWARDVAQPARLPKGPLTRLGYFGALHARSGVELLPELLSLLPDHHLTIAGGKPEELAWMESEAVRFGVRKRLTLSGALDRAALEKVIENIDLLLLPAKSYPRALEYLALDRPIIAADVPAVREELGTEGAAIYATAEDPHAWANAIARLEEDRVLAERMVEAARRRARAFTWEARAARLLETFALDGS